MLFDWPQRRSALAADGLGGGRASRGSRRGSRRRRRGRGRTAACGARRPRSGRAPRSAADLEPLGADVARRRGSRWVLDHAEPTRAGAVRRRRRRPRSRRLLRLDGAHATNSGPCSSSCSRAAELRRHRRPARRPGRRGARPARARALTEMGGADPDAAVGLTDYLLGPGGSDRPRRRGPPAPERPRGQRPRRHAWSPSCACWRRAAQLPEIPPPRGGSGAPPSPPLPRPAPPRRGAPAPAGPLADPSAERSPRGPAGAAPAAWSAARGPRLDGSAATRGCCSASARSALLVDRGRRRAHRLRRRRRRAARARRPRPTSDDRS